MNKPTYKQLEEELEEAQEIIEDYEDQPQAQEETEGVWLISYADLMTLLMGFFALMVSMSEFSEEKFAETAEKIVMFTGGEISQPFAKVGNTVKELVQQKGLLDQVEVTVNKTNMQIQFKGTLLFGSGSFSLKSDANALMEEITKILAQEAPDKKVLIEGHTDSQPINRGVVASNWELSSLRANVVARLFETHGFKSNQILTIGLGDTRPLVPHTDKQGETIPENQAKNRRVVIKVMNQHPI